MKKIITILATIALSCAMVNTVHAKKGTKTSSIPQQQTQAQKSTTMIDKKTTADTRKLNDTMKALTTANTPEKKAVVKQKISEAAAELLEDLEETHEERSTFSELITGYSKEQKDKAKAKLADLYPMKVKLDKKIKDLNDIWAVITTEDGSPVKGKEATYEIAKQKFSEWIPLSEKIDNIIYNQEIIAGIKWSTAFKSLMYAAALGADYHLFGGTVTGISAVKAGLSLAAAWGTLNALLETQNKLNLAQFAYNSAKDFLNSLLADPDATPEEIAKAEKNVAQKQTEQKKLEQQVKQQQQKQPAKA